VAELLARAEEQVERFETEVKRLWEGWVAAEEEVEGLMRGVVGGSLTQRDGAAAEGGNAGWDDGAEVLRRFKEVIEREIAEAEAEMFTLGEEAVGMMREVEKVSLSSVRGSGRDEGRGAN
jgi:hypothetical protein